MYHTDWIAEFRQKLVPDHTITRREEYEAGKEASPLVKRWLMLADQLLSTDASEVEPA